MDYQVWKWLDTGEVEFRIAAVSRRARDRQPARPARRRPASPAASSSSSTATCARGWPATRARRARAPRRRPDLRPRLASSARHERTGVGGVRAMSTVWGVPYLFIKVAVDDGVPPAVVAWSRVVLAAGVLLALAWRAGTLRDAARALALARRLSRVFEITIPFPLIAAGERHVDSSVAAIIIAAAPLIVALLALRFDDDERVSGRRLVGLLIGLGGVVALVGIDIAGRTRRAARRGRDPRRRRRLRGRPDDPQAHARRRRPARDDGDEPRRSPAVLLTPLAALDPPAAVPSDGRDRLAARARPGVHGRGVRHLQRAHRRDRPGPRARHHLRRPRRRGRARRRRARRAAGRRRGGRACC